MYHFFLHTAETTLPCLLPIRKTTPNPLHANSMRGKLHIALWLLLTGVKRGEYYLYELLKDGKSGLYCRSLHGALAITIFNYSHGGG